MINAYIEPPNTGKNASKEGIIMAAELGNWNRDVGDEQIEDYSRLLNNAKFHMMLQDGYWVALPRCHTLLAK
jgi:hypothetical protein